MHMTGQLLWLSRMCMASPSICLMGCCTLFRRKQPELVHQQPTTNILHKLKWANASTSFASCTLKWASLKSVMNQPWRLATIILPLLNSKNSDWPTATVSTLRTTFIAWNYTSLASSHHIGSRQTTTVLISTPNPFLRRSCVLYDLAKLGILTDRYHLLICRLLPQPSGLVVQHWTDVLQLGGCKITTPTKRTRRYPVSWRCWFLEVLVYSFTYEIFRVVPQISHLSGFTLVTVHRSTASRVDWGNSNSKEKC